MVVWHISFILHKLYFPMHWSVWKKNSKIVILIFIFAGKFLIKNPDKTRRAKCLLGYVPTKWYVSFFCRRQLIQILKKTTILSALGPSCFFRGLVCFLTWKIQYRNIPIECDLNFLFFIQMAIQLEKFICSNLPSFNCKL